MYFALLTDLTQEQLDLKTGTCNLKRSAYTLVYGDLAYAVGLLAAGLLSAGASATTEPLGSADLSVSA